MTLISYGHAASMVNRISCDSKQNNSSVQRLTSDTVIEVVIVAWIFFFIARGVKVSCSKLLWSYFCDIQVSIEIPFAFRAIPVQAIESTGTQVLDQILKLMLPRFLAQVFHFFFPDQSYNRVTCFCSIILCS